MSDFSVSKQFRTGLEALRDLHNDKAKELLTALNTAEPSLKKKALLSRVTSTIEGMELDIAREIISALLYLYSYRSYSNLSTSKMAEEVAYSDDLAMSEEDREQFKQRLLGFLNVDAITVTAKAFAVMSSNEHTLTKTRIVTDLRPIFNDDSPEDKPVAAVIVHMLKISYYQDGEHRDFFAAMDTEDVTELRKVLDRAEAKARSLVEVTEAANIRYLEPTDEDDPD